MTEQDFNKAKALFEQREYYTKLVQDVNYAIWNKNRLDEEAREYIAENHPYTHKERWTLAEYFKVRFFNKSKNDEIPQPTIGVRPHWDFARDIEIKADPELINLILEWLKEKVKRLDEQIAEVGESEVKPND